MKETRYDIVKMIGHKKELLKLNEQLKNNGYDKNNMLYGYTKEQLKEDRELYNELIDHLIQDRQKLIKYIYCFSSTLTKMYEYN